MEWNEQSVLIEMLPGSVWIVRPDGAPEYLSPSIFEYTGKAPDVGIDWLTVIHPDDFLAVSQAWQQMVQEGQPFEIEFRQRRFDGVYRWFQSRTKPMRGADGEIVRWYGLTWDIDDRKQAIAAVERSERHLRGIIETIPALVWSATPDGHRNYANQRVLDYTGVSFDQLADRGWLQLVHPDDVNAASLRWLRSIETGASYQDAYRIRGADGVYRWFQSLGEAMRDSTGKIFYWYGIIIDIDDSRKTADELGHAQGKLSRASKMATVAELSASIAHEINQPLTAVIANGHACQTWLLSDPPNLERAQRTVERIIRNGNSAADVVRRIRALFKQADPTKVRLDINDVIAEVLRLVIDDVRKKRVSVEVDFEDGLPLTLADRVQIQQAVINLVQNALDAMDSVADGSRWLSLSTRREGRSISIQVSDRGVGIANPECIFDPFFTTKENGMGMGLSICRSIIEAHGGRIWVAANPDAGSTFHFTLPLEPGVAT